MAIYPQALKYWVQLTTSNIVVCYNKEGKIMFEKKEGNAE